jgi:hypothetical protein
LTTKGHPYTNGQRLRVGILGIFSVLVMKYLAVETTSF